LHGSGQQALHAEANIALMGPDQLRHEGALC